MSPSLITLPSPIPSCQPQRPSATSPFCVGGSPALPGKLCLLPCPTCRGKHGTQRIKYRASFSDCSPSSWRCYNSSSCSWGLGEKWLYPKCENRERREECLLMVSRPGWDRLKFCFCFCCPGPSNLGQVASCPELSLGPCCVMDVSTDVSVLLGCA